jgi:hypothetical protein
MWFSRLVFGQAPKDKDISRNKAGAILLPKIYYLLCAHDTRTWMADGVSETPTQSPLIFNILAPEFF